MRIALLEDDNYQADVMRAWLESAGHECRVYPTGQAFREGMRCGDFDLAILDWVLPDTDGVAVLAWLREHCEWHIPVIFVTRMDREEDVVIALEKGADDYMTKPVKPREMQARIAAVARRVHLPTERTDLLEVGDYRLNLQSRTVEWRGERVDLTHKEFDLALFLFRQIGRLLSRAQIMETVWGTSAELNTRTVDTHVSRIRNKLRLQPEHGWKLSAIYQHGYRLEHLEADAGASDSLSSVS